MPPRYLLCSPSGRWMFAPSYSRRCDCLTKMKFLPSHKVVGEARSWKLRQNTTNDKMTVEVNLWIEILQNIEETGTYLYPGQQGRHLFVVYLHYPQYPHPHISQADEEVAGLVYHANAAVQRKLGSQQGHVQRTCFPLSTLCHCSKLFYRVLPVLQERRKSGVERRSMMAPRQTMPIEATTALDAR